MNGDTEPLGDGLLKLFRDAEYEVCLVAPFIKARTLARLLAVVGDDVRVVVVTRWRVSEVVAGVSDLDVYRLLEDRSGLLLKQDLHAKFYRRDRTALVGSANVTAAALGWTDSPNLELLMPHALPNQALDSFEAKLMGAAVPVTRRLYEEFGEAVEALIDPADYERTDVAADPEVISRNSDWVPATRHPESLYSIYCAPDRTVLPRVARALGESDLRHLGIPDGLSEEGFLVAVRVALISMPVVMRLDQHLEEPRRFGEVRSLLRRWYGFSNDEATYAWQNLIRWFGVFASERYGYQRPRHSEVIYLRPVIGGS